MKIVFKGTRLEITPRIEEYAQEKFQSLDKHFHEIQIARVELESLTERRTQEKFRAEATIDAPKHIFRAEARSEDIYAAIDLLVPKIIAQIGKVKQRKVSRIKAVRRKIKEGRLDETENLL